MANLNFFFFFALLRRPARNCQMNELARTSVGCGAWCRWSAERSLGCGLCVELRTQQGGTQGLILPLQL